MNASTIQPHRTECPACSGSGRNYGNACCGGQGCSRCDRPCESCDGECSVEGFCASNEVVDLERAEEIHESAEPDIPCRVEECPFCERDEAAQQASAVAAGIPRSVVEGRTKLSDHFSNVAIDLMCGRNTKEQE
jgi:hypothetical protein